jgi:hypothetical protein
MEEIKKTIRIVILFLLVISSIIGIYYMTSKEYAKITVFTEWISGDENKSESAKYVEVIDSKSSFIDKCYHLINNESAPEEEMKYEKIAFYLVIGGSIITIFGAILFGIKKKIFLGIIGQIMCFSGAFLFSKIIMEIDKTIVEESGIFGGFISKLYEISTTADTLKWIFIVCFIAVGLLSIIHMYNPEKSIAEMQEEEE